MKIQITVEIEPKEVCEDYADVADEIIFDDLRFGNLLDVCRLVKVEKKGGKGGDYER